MLINHKLYTRLSNLYCQPNRHYHNINHINHCLGELESFIENNPNTFFLKREVTLALWFHDIVYNPYSKQNEENSANFFKECSKEYDFSADEDLVYKLILGTKNHYVSDILEQNIVNDIDLASLGQPEHVFLKNSEDIRKEFWFATPEEFKLGRLSFLNEMLKRPRIFHTEYFCGKYEAKARRNISKSIKIIASS